MSKLLIVYRDADARENAAHITERLAASFGSGVVASLDLDSADDGEALQASVDAARVVIAAIGHRWLTAPVAVSLPRRHAPGAMIEAAIARALQRSDVLTPLLVDDAPQPSAHDLPPSISTLASLQPLRIHGDQRFARDMETLIEQVAPRVGIAPAYAPTEPLLPIVAVNPSTPVTHIPQRLAALGFSGQTANGVEFITPPLVTVTAGPFLMGSDRETDAQAWSDEEPQHWVQLDAFEIGAFPVTVAEYALAAQDGFVAEPQAFERMTWQRQLQRPDHPVVCVSWRDALAYAYWLRQVSGDDGWWLPSEAQWEKAARWDAARGAALRYPWGDTFEAARCNTREGGVGKTTPVGSYPFGDVWGSGASPSGAEEMAGNVWEWTTSRFQPYPYAPDDGREDPNAAGQRVLRGGSWSGIAAVSRSACRAGLDPRDLNNLTGFRLIRAPQ